MHKILYFSGVIEIVILGTGNVAKQLFDAFLKSEGVHVVQVAGRNSRALEYFTKYANTRVGFEDLAEADIYLIALSDDAIPDIAETLAREDRLLAHTSGSTALNKMPEIGRRGVFYPLQTFSMYTAIDFDEVPLCLEAENDKDYQMLEQLAGGISQNVSRVDSRQRLQLHMAAVFVNNFTNHLFHIGEELCEEKGLSFDLLRPLIRETVNKIENLDPFQAQTGPARRGDTTTMQRQLDNLRSKTHKDIYKLISESIHSTYAEKL